MMIEKKKNVRSLIIALDGPAGVGKSTVALRLAELLGITYLETGALYRAVALLGLRNGISLEDAAALAKLAAALEISFRCVDGVNHVYLGAEEITAALRTQEVAAGSSKVATLPEVRAALLDLQRQFAGRKGGVVAEGRDVGTVVFPGATLKIFLTASDRERARRRHLQLQQAGKDTSFEEILKAVIDRDREDSTRSVAPLKKADDAVAVDCTELSAEQVVETILGLLPEQGEPKPEAPAKAGDGSFRSGYVAVVGRPNVGKSTLVNQLVGSKVAITSTKPQTTRNRILGMLNGDGYQIVFVDTPGIHESKRVLNRVMVASAVEILDQVDVVCLVLDVTKHVRNSEGNLENNLAIIKRVEQASAKCMVLLNKVDLVPKPLLLPLIERYAQEPAVSEVIPVSAKTGAGVKDLVATLIRYLPDNGEPLFPIDQVTDRSQNFRFSETIREKVLDFTHQEIPHSTAVTVDLVERTEGKGRAPFLHIEATIHVERSSQKGIIIGKGGEMLRRIGEAARVDLEREQGCKVMLKLFVRVEKDWTGSEHGLQKVEYRP